MKVSTEPTNFACAGVQEQHRFSIDQSSHVFRMLSDDVYKNKVQAVIRELSTNAYDAHLLNDNASPWYVHLPTEDEPTFSIRDYGPGLSLADMTTLYRTYGRSGLEKLQNNQYIGGLGIGSKSPLCYAQSFTAISYHNGMKYIFIVALDADRCPTLNKVGEHITTEPNGLEVSLAVKQQDINRFRAEFIRVYRWFPQQPKTNIDIAVNKVKPKLSGTNWELSLNGSSSYALMGNIAYPICPQSLYGNSFYGNDERNMLEYGLVLRFDMGEVEFVISREELQYTDKTKDAIIDRLKVCKAEITDQIEKEIAVCQNYYDAVMKYYDELNKFTFIKPEFNGRSLNKQRFLKEKVTHLHRSYGGRVSQNITNYVYLKKDCVLVHKDCERGFLARSKQYTRDTGKDIYILNDAAKKEICADIGINDSHFTPASTLPKVRRTKSGSTNSNYTTGVYKYNVTNTNWDTDKVKLGDKGVYVRIKNWRAGLPLIDIEQAFKKFGVAFPEIYGIIPSKLDVVRKKPGWMNFKDIVQGELDKYLNKNPQLLVADSKWNSVKDHVPDWYQALTKYKDTITNKELILFEEKITKLKTDVSEYKKLTRALDYYFEFPKTLDSNLSIKQEVADLEAKYPILEMSVGSYGAVISLDKFKIISQYLNKGAI